MKYGVIEIPTTRWFEEVDPLKPGIYEVQRRNLQGTGLLEWTEIVGWRNVEDSMPTTFGGRGDKWRGARTKFFIGQTVHLKPFEDQGPEEGIVLGVPPPYGEMYIVQLNSSFYDAADDDGLRECDVGQLEEAEDDDSL